MGDRDKQRVHVYAECKTGGIGRDHELVPKVSTDDQARDTLIRLRNSVLSPAAGAEVVFPIDVPHDANSTQALRQDDEIMDFQLIPRTA